MMEIRFPWEPSPAAPETQVLAPGSPSQNKRRGRRPASLVRNAAAPGGWLYHHLTVSRPADPMAAFADAARGAGVIPWQLDFVALEEDLFTLAVSQHASQRNLTVTGCRILARQSRDRVEARQTRAIALIGRSRACPFDLHTLLPVPVPILRLGPTHPDATTWLSTHRGLTDGLRHVVTRQKPTSGRRLPAGDAVVGCGFFAMHESPHAALTQLRARWPALRFVLQPRPAD